MTTTGRGPPPEDSIGSETPAMTVTDWALLSMALALPCVAAFLISFTYWPATNRAKARIARADLVHYMPERYLNTDGRQVRLAPAPGRKWIYLYEGRTFPWIGAIANHTRVGKDRRHPYACVTFKGEDVTSPAWTDKVLRRPLDGALKLQCPIETTAVMTRNIIPSRHRLTTPD